MIPQLSSDEQRRAGAGDQADQQRQVEDEDGAASHEQQEDDRKHRRQRREYRTRAGRLDGFIDELTVFFLSDASAVCAHTVTDTVEDNDGVIDGVTDDGEQHRNDLRIDLQTEDGAEGQDDQHVMDQCHDGRKRIVPLEAHAHIDQDTDPGQHGDDHGIAHQLLADDRRNGVVRYLMTIRLLQACLDGAHRIRIDGILQIDAGDIAFRTVDLHAGRIKAELLQLRFQRILIDRRIALDGQRRTAGEVDAQVHDSVAAEAVDTHADDGDHQDGQRCADEVFCLADEIKSLELRELAAFLSLGDIRHIALLDTEELIALVQITAVDQQAQQEADDEHDQQQRGDRRDDEHRREALHAARTEDVQDERGDERGQLRVDDRAEGVLGSFAEGRLDAAAGIHGFLDALKGQDVGVDRHADTEHERRNAGQREYRAHGIVQQEYDEDVYGKRDRGDDARQAVDADHEQHDRGHADRAGQHRG